MSQFHVGQTVVATGSYGWNLTTGKHYTVVGVEPPSSEPTFTWPEYVSVIGDHGKKVTGHNYRFRPLTAPPVTG